MPALSHFTTFHWKWGGFTRTEKLLFAIIAATAALDAVALPFSGMRVDFGSTLPALSASALLLLLGGLYRGSGRSDRIAAMAIGTAALLLFSMVAGIGNYLAATLQRPLIDAQLVTLDAGLGFHWPAVIAAVQQSPILDVALTLAYVSSLPQIALIVIIVALSGRLKRLDTFLLAFVLAATLTILFWAAFPSFGAFAHYHTLGLPINDRGLAVDGAYVRELLAVRAGAVSAIEVDKLTGLIAFPSFHTVIAVLAIYAAYPVRHVGKLLVVFNVVVICSVPIDGGHHLVDVIAGAAVALLALQAAARLTGEPLAPLRAGAVPSGLKAPG